MTWFFEPFKFTTTNQIIVTSNNIFMSQILPFSLLFILCKLSSGKIKNGAEQSLSASTKRITTKSGSISPNCQSATENRKVNQLKLCQCGLSCSAFRSLWAHLMWDRIDPCTWAVRFTFSAAVSFSHFRFAFSCDQSWLGRIIHQKSFQM